MTDLKFEDFITFIYTQDIEKMKEFYGEILALPMVLEQSNCFVYRINEKSHIGVCGVDWTSPQPMKMEDRNMMITLVTDQLEEWDARLKEKGVTYEDGLGHYDEYKLTRILVRDPSNYLVEILRFDDPDCLKSD